MCGWIPLQLVGSNWRDYAIDCSRAGIAGKNMNVAIYGRVSTSKQDAESQMGEVRRYAAAREWPITEEYVDEGWSGSKASRPELNRLMKDAVARKIDCILVYKIDRFGRSVRHLVDSLDKLRSAGVRFVAISQGLDMNSNDPTAMLIFHVLSACAEFERSLIRERVAAGMKRARETGTKSGKAIGRPRVILDRQKVWDARDGGMSITGIQNEFGLSRGMVQRVLGTRT